MGDCEVIITGDTVPADTGIEESELERIGATIRPIKANTESDLIEKATGCSAIIAKNNPPVTGKVLKALDKCKIVARAGAGVDSIDISAARHKGLLVTNVESYCEDEVSDHTLALILGCLRKITELTNEVKDGNWDRKRMKPAHRLNEMTLGLVGMGKISRLVAKKSAQFGFRLIGYDPYASETRFLKSEVEKASWKKLLETSDVISIHVPLTNETKDMFRSREFRKMKDSAYVVNTSRGKIIDQGSLIDALRSGHIAGAGLDVLQEEPPEKNALFGLENVAITPHVAWYSEESERECRQRAAREIRRALTGKDPLSPVSSRGYTRNG